MALHPASIFETYLAYLGRPPDAYALLYEPFKSSTQVQPALFASFANSAEYASVAGTHLHDTAALVNDTYYRLFDRGAEAAGSNYWVGLVDSGALAIEDMPMAILQSAAGADAIWAANKVTYSRLALAWFTPQQQTNYAGMEAAAAGREFLRHANSDIVATPERLHEILLEQIAAMFANVVPHPPGAVFTLTSQADQVGTLMPTTLQNTAFGVTSSGPDLFEDPLGVTLTPQRFAGDRLDGGGGMDTLRVLNADADTSAAQITSVELVQASFGAAPALLDLSGIPDLQRLELHPTLGEPGFVTVRGMSSAVAVSARMVVDAGELLLQYADRASPDQSVTIDLTGSHAAAGGRGAILSVPEIEHITIQVGHDDTGPAGTTLPGIAAAQASTLVLDANGPVTVSGVQLAAGAQVTIESDSIVRTGTSAASMPQCDVLFDGTGVMDAHLDALASFTSTSSGVVALTVSGSPQVHVAENGTGSIKVIFGAHVGHVAANGGTESDSFVLTDPRTIAMLTGGSGDDVFTFTDALAGDDLATLIAAAPIVTDFGSTGVDRLRFTQPLHVSEQPALAAHLARIDAAGQATFDPADASLQQKIAAVAAGLLAGNSPGAGAYAVFPQDGDTYVFKGAGAEPLDNWGGTELVRLAGTVLDPSQFGPIDGVLVAW